MMDGNDANQDLGATFLSSDSQLFVQSDGDGKTRENFLYVIQCDDIILLIHQKEKTAWEETMQMIPVMEMEVIIQIPC